VTLVDRYTFGDREQVTLQMAPCMAPALRESESDDHPHEEIPLTPDERHFADGDEEPLDRSAAQTPNWLARYVALGFSLVLWLRSPDPANDWKGPRDPSWPTKTYHPADYCDGMQVGVKLGTEITPGRYLGMRIRLGSGHSVCLSISPATGFRFGRASKPLGHAFYTSSSPVTTYKFKTSTGPLSWSGA
jgi:hypothetical protein